MSLVNLSQYTTSIPNNPKISVSKIADSKYIFRILSFVIICMLTFSSYSNETSETQNLFLGYFKLVSFNEWF